MPSPAYVHDWFWSCCNCVVQGGMSVAATLACPGCGVYRCDNCPSESVKRKLSKSPEPKRTAKRARASSPQSCAPKRHAEINASLNSAKNHVKAIAKELLHSQSASKNSGKHTRSSKDREQVSAKTKDAKPKPKARQTKHVPRSLAGNLSEPKRNFACPFHKGDRAKFDPRSDKRYRTCLSPSIPMYEIRRIK